MKIRIWHIVVFAVALVIFAIAGAPAGFFFPQRPGEVTYARAEGTVWNARLEGVHVGPYAAERARWTLSPLDVIRGKAIVPVDFEDGTIEGRVTLLGNVQGDRRIAMPHLRLQGLTLGELSLPGETRMNGVDILFEDGVCTRAQGRAASDVLMRAGQAIGWLGPSVAGTATCDGDDARILLTGANSVGERVNVRIVLRGGGAASWRISVQTGRAETIAALNAAGFTRGVADGALGYGEDTRWLP